MNADQQIQQLSDVLRLAYEPQDWGITNSDPARVLEFLRFSERAELTPIQQYALVELILASMNDALAEGRVNDDLLDAFGRFLRGNLHGLTPQIQYWSSLPDTGEFPITELLHRQAGAV